MTHALMSTQVFITLAIVENNRMLMRPILPVTTPFFFLLSIYREYQQVKELIDACLYLLDSVGMASSLLLDFGCIFTKALWWGVTT